LECPSFPRRGSTITRLPPKRKTDGDAPSSQRRSDRRGENGNGGGPSRKNTEAGRSYGLQEAHTRKRMARLQRETGAAPIPTPNYKLGQGQDNHAGRTADGGSIDPGSGLRRKKVQGITGPSLCATAKKSIRRSRHAEVFGGVGILFEKCNTSRGIFQGESTQSKPKTPKITTHSSFSGIRKTTG